jgi:hypothetical protein
MGPPKSRLDWPQGWERTPAKEREYTRKFDSTIGKTTNQLTAEMGRVEPDDWRVSTGSGGGHTRGNGLPKASANPDDPGFVLRWTKDDHQHAVACDAYVRLVSNARAILLWMRETRLRSHRPVRTGQDEFATARLPSGDEDAITTRPPPHEVLGIQSDAPEGLVQAAYREKMKEAHPDQGGTNQESKLVQWAREQMLEDGTET